MLPFAEEVLVGRGDIDERRERMRELESQVTRRAAGRSHVEGEAPASFLNRRSRSCGCKGAERTPYSVMVFALRQHPVLR